MGFTRGDTTVGGTGEAFTDAVDRIDLELEALDTRLDVVEVSGPHSHTNKAVIDLITDAGSTSIITDAERFKLSTVETSATADQTDAEIKTAYENNADTNPFTDADKVIVDAAYTTDAAIKAAYENNADTNGLTDANVIQLARPYAIVQISNGTQALAFTVTTLFNCDTTSGDAILTLPAALDGATITFKKSDVSANDVIINPDGSETIDGAANDTLTGVLRPSRTYVGIAGTGWVNI